jgi:hypothetical protein
MCITADATKGVNALNRRSGSCGVRGLCRSRCSTKERLANRIPTELGFVGSHSLGSSVITGEFPADKAKNSTPPFVHSGQARLKEHS